MDEEERTRHARLERLYGEASALTGRDRDAFLDEECSGDEALRGELNSLFAAESRLASFERGVPLGQLSGLGDAAERDAAAAGWLPERVGSYSIQKQVGRGTMGVVFEALQASPKRKVALKLSHPMVTTDASLERLRREAELLGRLQHPGIAQVYESGVHEVDGQVQPFFAMEFIEGDSLLVHADERRLDQRARVKLMVSVCEGVQHAHEQGIVHRDLKPENIVVDQRGQTKLLDFGIARIVEAADVECAMRTQAGELLGTLAYMAPEQAAGESVDVTPATDVFSLGVVAYELLSGRLPRNMRGMNVTTAVDTVSQTEPRRLREDLPGVEKDLETVLGKALEMRAAERYPSAAALAADLQRVLERRPILAKPPTAFDRLRKYVLRNRALVMTATVITLLLAAGLLSARRDAQRQTERRLATMRDLYASEMLRATRVGSSASGLLNLDSVVSKWVPADGEPDLRGWEWRFLDGLSDSAGLTIPLAGMGMSVDWHPSGEQVVSGSVALIEVFDADSGERLAAWPEQSETSFFLTAVRFSPDGERVLFCGWNVVGIWRPGASEAEWIHEGVGYHSAAWGPDGRWVVATEENSLGLRKFDAESGEELQAVPGAGTRFQFRNVSADGRWTTGLGENCAPLVIDLASGQQGPELRERGQVTMCAVLDPQAERLAESGWNNLIRIHALDGSADPIEIGGHNEQVDSVDWHPTEDLIASGSGDASVRVYNAGLGTLRRVFRGQRDRIREVRWSPDGSRLASASGGNEIRIWDLDASAAYRRRQLSLRSQPLFDVQLFFNRSSTEAHASHRSGSFAVETATGAVSRSRVGSNLESVSNDGRIRTFVRRREVGFEVVAASLPADEEVWARAYETDEPTVRSWHPHEPRLLVGGTLGFEMVDFTEGVRSMWTLPAERRVRGGAFDPAGDHVVIVEQWQPVFVVDAALGEVVTAIHLPEGVVGLGGAFSPTGQLLAIPCDDGVVRVHRALTGELVKELNGHTGKVFCAGWHPTEPRLATGSADGSVRLWDTLTFTPTASFDCGATVKALDWGAGGRVLAAVTAAGTMDFWEALDGPR